mmetsp:Transcript_8424/g.24760  ORF Transcript_8424/g.24760 Transcript_8424/m.24760 type:complete len:85 (+) Transcript_8424:369-623(+)
MRLVSKAICTEAEPVSSGDVLNSATSFKDGREFWSLATILTTRDWRPEEDEARTEEEDTCAVPLAKLLPVAENMFFRAFDAVET